MSIQKEAWFKTAEARGDCYEAAGKIMMDRGRLGKESHLILVHGEVGGQGPLEGTRFGHAWVEDGDMVLDYSNGRQLEIPKMLYYALGQVRSDFPPFEMNLHKYSVEEFAVKVVEYGHWGPWDLKTSSGL